MIIIDKNEYYISLVCNCIFYMYTQYLLKVLKNNITLISIVYINSYLQFDPIFKLISLLGSVQHSILYQEF